MFIKSPLDNNNLNNKNETRISGFRFVLQVIA